MAIRVVLVDDQYIFREVLTAWLRPLPDLEIVGTAANGQEALALVAMTMPDVVVMDIHMPIMDGITTTAALRQRDPGCRIVLLTTFEDVVQIQAGLAAGALSYVTKNDVADMLHTAIQWAARGQSWLPPSVATPLVQALQVALPPPAVRPSPLSSRERDVLRLVSQNLPNRQIALDLHMSEGTLKNHLTHILQKLQAPNCHTAVLLATEAGWL